MKGFTLIEILIAVLLLTFVIGSVMAVFSMGRNVYSSSEAMMEMQEMARRSIGGMITELRQSRLADISISNGDTISFSIPISVNPLSRSSTIKYFVNANNQLVREHPLGTEKIIANNVDSLNFTLNGNILEVKVQANIDLKRQDLMFTIKEQVALRS